MRGRFPGPAFMRTSFFIWEAFGILEMGSGGVRVVLIRLTSFVASCFIVLGARADDPHTRSRGFEWGGGKDANPQSDRQRCVDDLQKFIGKDVCQHISVIQQTGADIFSQDSKFPGHINNFNNTYCSDAPLQSLEDRMQGWCGSYSQNNPAGTDLGFNLRRMKDELNWFVGHMNGTSNENVKLKGLASKLEELQKQNHFKNVLDRQKSAGALF